MVKNLGSDATSAGGPTLASMRRVLCGDESDDAFSKSTRLLCLTDVKTSNDRKKVIACVVLYIKIELKVANVLDAKGSKEKKNLSVSKRSGSIDNTQATNSSQVVVSSLVSSTCCLSEYIRLVR
jgi:hypothetical protein